jgi:transcriptional regulator with XRE-family HTH domain
VDNIGQRLKEERQLRGWSQRDLARETGVNTDTISGIETGQHEPRPSTLRKLAAGLGLEVRDLFTEPALPKDEARSKPGPGGREIKRSVQDAIAVSDHVEVHLVERAARIVRAWAAGEITTAEADKELEELLAA